MLLYFFQSGFSGASHLYSRQMSEMSTAEEDCIDATEEGKGMGWKGGLSILWKNVMVLLYVLKEDYGISENADNLLIFLNKGVELYIRCSQFF